MGNLTRSGFRFDDWVLVRPDAYAKRRGWVPSPVSSVPLHEVGRACSRAGLMMLELRFDASAIYDARRAARKAGVTSKRELVRAGAEALTDCRWVLGLYRCDDYGRRDRRDRSLLVDVDAMQRNEHDAHDTGAALPYGRAVADWDEAHGRSTSDELLVGVRAGSYELYRDAWMAAHPYAEVPVLPVTLDTKAMDEVRSIGIPRAYYMLGLAPVETSTSYVPLLSLRELLDLCVVFDYDPWTARSNRDLHEVPIDDLPRMIDGYHRLVAARVNAAETREREERMARYSRSTDPVLSTNHTTLLHDARNTTAATNTVTPATGTATGIVTTRAGAAVNHATSTTSADDATNKKPRRLIRAPRNLPKRGARRNRVTRADLEVRPWHQASGRESLGQAARRITTRPTTR
ncbi:hypothetical protein [Bifidobacterium vansinderenii]|uniref:Uncharacterized protein n=1 Tax=Bifidobacterium vansinderenii TaxID=1984871 RepID=A0A229VXS8_9BIFI|nr:hypothetical protein [Bifidobacterium vansinderenii]OXN00423.1 hypothetical protein Tam10B_1293 [Bifidobacterium vansinderenii]